MPRLILLNGPPGCGKSTLARMYADGHPLTLNLDIDLIRAQIGQWRYDRLMSVIAARPGTRLVPSIDGEPTATYRALLDALFG